MENLGKYLYCITEGADSRNFGPIGIGGRGDVVGTIGYRDLSAVISDAPMTKYEISPERLTAHEVVIEKVMKDTPRVLPVRYCTIAASAEEIRTLLRIRYREFKNLLQRMDNKVELGVKAWWKDMGAIFGEISREDEATRGMRARIAAGSEGGAAALKVELGRRVKAALEEKRRSEGERLAAPLKRVAHDFQIKKTHGDEMVLNSVYLVDGSRESQFDHEVQRLGEESRGRYRLVFVGPAPAFHFVNVEVNWK